MLLIRDARSPHPRIATLTRKDGKDGMRVIAVAVSKNLVAAGFRDGVVTLWDMNDWHEIASFQAQPSWLLWSGVLARRNASRELWRGARNPSVARRRNPQGSNGEPVPQSVLVRGHTRAVNSLMFAPGADGRTLLSSSADGTAKLWDLSVSIARTEPAGSSRPIWFSPRRQADADRAHKFTAPPVGRGQTVGPRSGRCFSSV